MLPDDDCPPATRGASAGAVADAGDGQPEIDALDQRRRFQIGDIFRIALQVFELGNRGDR